MRPVHLRNQWPKTTHHMVQAKHPGHHTPPTAPCDPSTCSRASHPRREGTQVMCLLPFSGWTLQALLISSPRGLICSHRLSHFCSGDDRQTPGWCPPCRAPGNPSAHNAALGPSSPCCPLQAAQPAPCSSACLMSLSWVWELIGLDKHHVARHTHVSHNLNHLWAF